MARHEPGLNLNDAWLAISRCLADVRSPYNDGWTSSARKKELYQLKYWLDHEYSQLPKFSEETEWEQERLIDILKKE